MLPCEKNAIRTIRAYSKYRLNDEQAQTAYESLSAIGVCANVGGIEGLEPQVWAAIVASAREEESYEQEALLEVIRAAGGVEACSIDWAEGVVTHAENGDRPENLDRGELDDSIMDYYDTLLDLRERYIAANEREGQTREDAEDGFYSYMTTSRRNRRTI